MRKRPTAADRPQFRRDVVDMIRTLGVQQGELDPGMAIVCTRASDFDPADNVLWEHEANRSAVRPDVRCVNCASVVAMSHDAYGRYGRLDRKPKVYCLQCMVEVLKRREASPV